MKLIHTFNEEQFSKNEINKMGVRRAIRAVIFDDDNNIAILHVQRDKYYSLPGGAVEKDETFQSGFVRECWEETGCRVEIVKEVGETFEIRGQNNMINNSVCYIAKIIGEKGPLNLDEDELDENIKLIWVDIDKAIELTSNYSNKVSLYNKYTRQRDIIFLKEVKSNL